MTKHCRVVKTTTNVVIMLVRRGWAIPFFFYLALCSHAEALQSSSAATRAQYQKLANMEWAPAFVFDGTAERPWKADWFLDGKLATLTQSPLGLDFWAGPEFYKDAHHAVLWTRQIFEGDLRIDYQYTKLDDTDKAVTIIYFHATGEGPEPYVEDIAKWRELREVPSMRKYFKNMHAYHISYAAFAVKNEDGPLADYVRLRQYQPAAIDGLRGTEILPDAKRTGLFAKGVPHDISLIKLKNALFMSVRNSEKSVVYKWNLDAVPALRKGRIGLRHMYTRAARYKNFVVSHPKK